jgi:hypothetical protein
MDTSRVGVVESTTTGGNLHDFAESVRKLKAVDEERE